MPFVYTIALLKQYTFYWRKVINLAALRLLTLLAEKIYSMSVSYSYYVVMVRKYSNKFGISLAYSYLCTK